MRKHFFPWPELATNDELEKAYRHIEAKLAPWATKVIQVDGGFKAYESVADYEMEKNQR